MHKSTYPICKEFLGLLPKALYHSPLHVTVWREFEDFLYGLKTQKLCAIKSSLYSKCLNASHCTALGCHQWVHKQWSGWNKCHAIFTPLDC